MQRFKSPEQAQRFLAAHAMIYSHFRPRRARDKAFRIWHQETCVQLAT
jgi:putative transposase